MTDSDFNEQKANAAKKVEFEEVELGENKAN